MLFLSSTLQKRSSDVMTRAMILPAIYRLGKYVYVWSRDVWFDLSFLISSSLLSLPLQFSHMLLSNAEAAVSLRDVARLSKLTAYYKRKLACYQDLHSENLEPDHSQALLLKAFYAT